MAKEIAGNYNLYNVAIGLENGGTWEKIVGATTETAAVKMATRDLQWEWKAENEISGHDFHKEPMEFTGISVQKLN